MKKNNLRFKNNIKSDSNNQNRNLSSRKQPKEVVFDLQEDYNRIPYNIQQPESIHPMACKNQKIMKFQIT